MGHEQLKARWRLAMANFLRVELRTSKIFISLAMKAVSVDDQARYARIARGAYLSVVHFASKASLDQTEKTRLTEELDDINSTLACLENSFSVAEPATNELERLIQLTEGFRSSCPEIHDLARQARQFELQCERTRDSAQQMLAQNHRLMAQYPKRTASPERH
jgi:hypothetical protein